MLASATVNDRYQVLGAIGRGASSWVYEVLDQQEDRRRAIKLLLDSAGCERGQVELSQLSGLEHPSLARLRDSGHTDRPLAAGAEGLPAIPAGTPFLVFDLVEGRDAHRHVSASRAPERRRQRLRELATQLASALLYLHRRGITHHDVAPQNVLVDRRGRAVLLDLGLAAAHGATPAAGRGTLPFMAPEALDGGGDHRVDLYGLGATLYYAATGRAPFAGATPAQLALAVLQQEVTFAEGEAAWLGADAVRLVRWLLRKDPGRRPSTAQTVLAELARMAGDHDAVARLTSQRQVVAPAFAGRAAPLAALEALLARLAQGPAAAAPCPVVLQVVGTPGVGKTRLIREALRRAGIRTLAGLLPGLRVLDALPTGAAEPPAQPPSAATTLALDDLAVRAVDELQRLAASQPTLLHLRDRDDPLARRALEILVADADGGRPAAPLLVLVEVERALQDGAWRSEQVARIDVPPLAPSETAALIASMIGEPPPNAAAERIHTLAAGIPLLASELTTQWATVGIDALEEWLDRSPSLAQLLASRRRSLPAPQARILDALAVWGRRVDAATLARLLDAPLERLRGELEPLLGSGSLALDSRGVGWLAAAHAEAWARDRPASALADLHRRAAAILAADEAGGLDRDQRRARHLIASAAEDAPRFATQTARRLWAARRPREALALLERIGGAAEAGTPLLLAELYVQVARYDDALSALGGEAASAAGDPPPDHALLRARALQLRGDYAQARATLEALLPRLAGAAPRREALALLGKLLVRQGDAAAALQRCAAEVGALMAQDPQRARLDPAGAALVEVVGLAHFYQGHLEPAAALFDAGAAALAQCADGRLVARFDNLRGMVAFSRGELQTARERYGRALELARQAGDVHGAATYTGCTGSVLVDMGEYAAALPALREARQGLGRLGRTGELVAATCNLAHLQLLLGDTEEARRLLERAQALEQEVGTRQWRGSVELVAGDIARRDGQPARALERYRAAAQAFALAADQRQRRLAELAAAPVLAELGGAEEAAALVAAAEGEGAPAGPVALCRARLLLARRRLRRPAGEPPPAEQEGDDVARALAAHCAELARRRALTDLWPAASALARLIAGREGGEQALRQARQVWEEIMSKAPELYRERMAADPETRALAEAWQAIADGAPPVAAPSPARTDAGDEQQLRRLLALNKRLNSELDLARLLELIIDTVIELTDAERGFLLLVEEDGRMSVRVARNIAQDSLEGDASHLSRSIAEQAARSGEPVVTVDAADDGRFAAALSVSNLRLRSVLAVPLLVKGKTVGTVYVDHRLRRGVFGSAEIRLMQDLADQAAIAIETARLLEENRHRQAEIEGLNARLAATVEHQRAALIEAHEELRSSRDALRTRYEYANIVGRSPRMRELFRLLDRVTDTELPVVIQGASGTGKELVARAIHHNGPRATKPFVGENCGAIPETLLESILFGYVRGAFTGADRDRKGLFEIADGGTLFLDEVGEMSPAMQTKLLRVLQDGEFRRVGGERALHTDVRLIAASNANLTERVASGAFREDLYYRINVVRIEIPPLVERREDIPLLVEHFLAKHGQTGRRVSPAAMSLLTGYSWPGNVRELENEIMRVAALAEGTVTPDDLSPHVRGSAPLLLRDADDLRLKPRVEHLERELIRRALDATAGNQTKAAALLGLSRYGLLKKIRRHFPGAPE